MFDGVTIKEITGAQQFELGELRVTTAELTHTMYDVGYRFEGSGKIVVVSGDTSFDERLVDLARGADMLVMDGDERWAGRSWCTRWPRSRLWSPSTGRPGTTAAISPCVLTRLWRRSPGWPRRRG